MEQTPVGGKTAAQSIIISATGAEVGKDILGMELVDPSVRLSRKGLPQRLFITRGSAVEYGTNLVAYAIQTFGLCSTDFYRQWGAIGHTIEGATGLPRIISSALLAYYSPQTHAGQNLIGSLVRSTQTRMRKGKKGVDVVINGVNIPFHQFIREVVEDIQAKGGSPVGVIANILKSAEEVYDDLETLWYILDDVVGQLPDNATLDHLLEAFETAITKTGRERAYAFPVAPETGAVVEKKKLAEIRKKIHESPENYGLILHEGKYYAPAVKKIGKQYFYQVNVDGETIQIPSKAKPKQVNNQPLYELKFTSKYKQQKGRASSSLTDHKETIKRGLNYVLDLNIQTDEDLLRVLRTNKDALGLMAIFFQKDFGVFNEQGLNEKVLNFLRNIYHYGADELPTMDTRMMELFGLFNFTKKEIGEWKDAEDGLGTYRSKIRDALFEEEVYYVWADESRELMEGIQKHLLEKTGVLLTIPEIQAALWNAIRSVSDTGAVAGSDVPNVFAHLFPRTIVAVLKKAANATSDDAASRVFTKRIFGDNYLQWIETTKTLLKQTDGEEELFERVRTAQFGNEAVGFEGAENVPLPYLSGLQVGNEDIPYTTPFLEEELQKITLQPTVVSEQGGDKIQRQTYQQKVAQFVDAFLKASETEKTILPRNPSQNLIATIATILQDTNPETEKYRRRLLTKLTNPNVPEHIFALYQQKLREQGVELTR